MAEQIAIGIGIEVSVRRLLSGFSIAIPNFQREAS